MYRIQFSIAPGNNSKLIRRCFERRLEYWKETKIGANFKWIPTTKNIRFSQLSLIHKQMVNHFEYHQEISTKDLLFRNLTSYAESNKVNVFDYLPLTFVIDIDCYISDIKKFITCYNTIEKITKLNNQIKMINSNIQQINVLKNKQHMKYCKAYIAKTHFAGKNVWILKPTGFNRGQGVTLFNSIDKLKQLIKYYSDAKSNTEGINNQKTDKEEFNQNTSSSVKSRTFVIQKYIERPLLIHNRKFDIRVWVLVTHEMRFYFFKEGYIRTSSATYSIDNDAINKHSIHLTNNAVQKYCQEYGAFEDGNQLSFNTLQVISNKD